METETEQCYKEMISMCEQRISQLNLGHIINSTIPENFSSPQEQSFSFSLNLTPGQGIGRKELLDAKSQLVKCKDKELLVALREEFTRQMRSHEMQRLTRAPPLPTTTSPTTAEHHYFASSDKQRYCHFDGQRIARELFVSDGEQPKLLLTGRDDSQMCQWNLEEAKIAEELGDEITEKDFNAVWFSHGGYPYVRPMRKIRRFLSTVVKK